MEFDPLSNRIIGCAIEVHKHLGQGLLESAYEECLIYELIENGMIVESQKIIPVFYKDKLIEHGYRADIIVEDTVLVELKCVEKIKSNHIAQMLTYLKFSGLKIGLLFNFNEKYLKDGMKRLVM